MSRRARYVTCALVGLAALLADPVVALAHGRLRKSEPAAKSVLAKSPAALRLWFTEKPDLAITKVTLTDSTGVIHPLGVITPDDSGTMGVRVPVPSVLVAGLYTVSWTTASADGHPVSGSFTFRMLADTTRPPVALAPAAVPADTTPSVTAPAVDDTRAMAPIQVLARTLSFVAMLMLIGAVVFRFAVLARVPIVDAEPRIATAAIIVALTWLAAAGLRLALQGDMMGASLRTVANDTQWGRAWEIQVAAGSLATLGFALVRSRVGGGWFMAALGAAGLAVGTALGGHAAAAEEYRTLSLLGDAVHVVAASAWLGTLFWLIVVALPMARSQPGDAARAVNAFSRVALIAAAAIVATGALSAWLRLGGLEPLWQSPYGKMLLRKLVMLTAVAAVGAWNWRRLRPLLAQGGGSQQLERAARLELVLALTVVIFTALLVGMPTPL